MYPDTGPTGGRESSIDPAFRGLEDVFDYPPELRDRFNWLMDVSATQKQAADELVELYIDAAKDGDLAATNELWEQAVWLYDISTTNQNAAEFLIRSYGRRQKIKKVAGRVLDIIHKPWAALPGLNHNTTPQALSPAIKDSGLSGG